MEKKVTATFDEDGYVTRWDPDPQASLWDPPSPHLDDLKLPLEDYLLKTGRLQRTRRSLSPVPYLAVSLCIMIAVAIMAIIVAAGIP